MADMIFSTLPCPRLSVYGIFKDLSVYMTQKLEMVQIEVSLEWEQNGQV